jgi:hypothetical protein
MNETMSQLAVTRRPAPQMREPARRIAHVAPGTGCKHLRT